GIRDDLVTGVQTCALPILVNNPQSMCETQNIAFTRTPRQQRFYCVLHSAIREVTQERVTCAERKKSQRRPLTTLCARKKSIYDRSEERRIGKECTSGVRKR